MTTSTLNMSFMLLVFLDFSHNSSCTGIHRGAIKVAWLQCVTNRNVDIGRMTIREIWVVNVSWTIIALPPNSFLLPNIRVVLREGVEHNIAQGIMTADAEGALATTKEVVSMLIQVRAASARLRTGGTEEGDSRPVTQGLQKTQSLSVSGPNWDWEQLIAKLGYEGP